MPNNSSRRLGAHLLAAIGFAGFVTSTAGHADSNVPLQNVAQVIAAEVETEAAAPAKAEIIDEAVEAVSHLGDGVASYYGKELAGNRTASGERFNPAALTAAHRSLPLGSKLRVTNKTNGKSVIVRINDRGPFHKGRLIDVSYAAAQKINMVSAGMAKVRLDLIR
jgi:rare lipoprotein A